MTSPRHPVDVTDQPGRERELVRQLEDQDETVRMRAAQALSAAGGAGVALASALGDASWRVRRAAATGVANADEAVEILITAVRERHRDPAVLNAALNALTQVGPHVVPAVEGLLGSGDVDVRTYAALALGLLDDDHAIGPLLAVLHDADMNVRFHAIEALGRLRAPQAGRPLARIAGTRDFTLSFAALEALAAIREPLVIPDILPLLEDDLFQGAAARCLGALGSEESVPALVSTLALANADVVSIAAGLALVHERLQQDFDAGALVADAVRAAVGPECAATLAASLATAADADLEGVALVLSWLPYEGIDLALGRLLARPSVRGLVADTLAHRGDGGLDALITALSGGDPEVRTLAIAALGRAGSTRAVPALIGVLTGEPQESVAAADALGKIGSRDAFEPLIALLGHELAAVRQAAVAALSSIGDPRLSSRVLALLADTSPLMRESAARIAGYFGLPSSLEGMLALSRDGHELVRRAAVEHLSYFEDARVAAVILAALDDPASDVRAAAARSLAQLSSRDATGPLLHALADEDLWVRYFAARSACRHRLDDGLLVTRLIDLTHPDQPPPVRIAATEALALATPDRVIPVLSALADDPNPEIARAAIAALGRQPSPAACGPLLAIVTDHASDRTGWALDALARQGHPSVWEAVAGIARRTSVAATRRRAFAVLARIGSEDAVMTLLDFAADRRSRDAAIEALATLSEEALPTLASAATHPDERVRRAMVEVLARARSPVASRLLMGALEDRSPAVRLEATRALARLDVRDVKRTFRVLAREDASEAVRWTAQSALRR